MAKGWMQQRPWAHPNLTPCIGTTEGHAATALRISSKKAKKKGKIYVHVFLVNGNPKIEQARRPSTKDKSLKIYF